MTTIDSTTRIPDDATMLRMETELFDRIDAADTMGAKRHMVHPRRRSGVRLRWAGIGSLAAGALAVALVMTNVLGFAGWRGGADPAAAAVLQQAAASATTMIDPVVASGDYLKVETTSMSVSWFGDAPYASTTTEQMFVPRDRKDDWVWIRPMSKPYATFGSESQKASDEYFAAIYGEHGADYVERLRAPEGRWYSGDSQVSPEALADLPSDPRLLLNFIYRTTIGTGPSADGEALVFIADRLRTGVIPADVRASLYQAAALIPGVEVVEDQATLDGRTGTAIGRVEANGNFRQDIIVDPDTGLFIGERTTTLADENGIAAGTITGWSTVTTSVVDEAPAGGTANGAFDDMGCVTTDGNSVCPQR
jgi:hypothetical protein